MPDPLTGQLLAQGCPFPIPAMHMRLILALAALLMLAQEAKAQRFMRTLPTLSALIASNPRDVHTNVFVQGRSAPNDGFQGTFYFVNGSSFSTNLGTVFATTYSGASGRWFRLVDGMYNVRWFGATGNGTTDDYVPLQNAINTAGLDGKGLDWTDRASERGDYATSQPLVVDGIRAMWKGQSSWTRIKHLEGSTFYDSLVRITNAPYQHRLEDLEIQGSAHTTNAIRLDHVAQSYFAHVKARDAIECGWYISDSVLNQFDTISCTQPGLFTRIAPKIGIKLTSNSNANLINNSITENLNTNDVYGAGIWIDGGSRNNVIMDGSSEFNYWGIYITNALCTTVMGIDMESNFAVDDVIDAGKFTQFINVLATKQLRLASPNRMSKVQGGQFGNIVVDSGVAGAILENVAYDILNNGATITDNGTGTAILGSQHTPTDARTGFSMKSGVTTPVLTLELNGAQDPTIQFYRSTAGVDEKRWRIFQTSANGDLRIEALSDDGLTSSAALRITRSGVNISELIVPNGNLQVDANMQVGGDSGARIASGAGDPEGAQGLPVGSLWLRTDATLGTGIYRKLAGGTSSSGWYAVSISPSITTDAAQTFVSSHADGVYVDLFHNDASPLHRYIRQQDGQVQLISDAFGAVTHRFSNDGLLGTEGVTPTSGIHSKTIAWAGAATAINATMGTNATVIVVSAAGRTITLPAASTASGRVYVVKNTATGTSTTVDVSGGGNIDSGTTDTLTSASLSQFYWSDGSQWWKIGGSGSGGGGGTDDQTAAEVPFTPAGSIAATDTQAAVEELDADITGLATLSDDPYDATGWDGVTNEAATKNALRDAFEALASVDDTAYNATTWDGVTDNAPSINAVRDKFVSVDAAIAAITGISASDIDTSAELLTIVGDETGTGVLTFNNSPTFADDITIHAAGVRLTGDGDGALTILGLGNGSDEDITINLDDTANHAVVSSSTGVNRFQFDNGIQLDAEDMLVRDDLTLTNALMAGDQVLYLNSTKTVRADSDFTFDGTTVTATTLTIGTTAKLPQGNNPTVSAAGGVSVDANDNSLRLYGSAERVIPTMQVCSITIFDPDGVQAVSDAIPILTVESTWAPAGITIRDIYLKTSASSTYSISLEEWTSPTDGAPTTIEAVATSSTTEAEDDGTLADGAIAAGSLIFVDLPATAESWIQVTFTYTVNANN
jgi:hypothetical protein